MKLRIPLAAILPVSLMLGPASAHSLADNAPSKIVDWKPTTGDLIRITCLDIGFSIRHLFDDGSNPTNQLRIENKRLTEIFQRYECSCVFTICPNGSVADLAMFKQSGSDLIDEQAMSFVKQAAPYKTAQKEPMRYVVYFPSVLARTYRDVTSPWQGAG